MSSLIREAFEARVQHAPFQVGQEYEDFLLGDTSDGAVATFVGRVRDHNSGSQIQTLELEHYPGMTEKVMLQVLESARMRWPITAARVVHRVGKLSPGENIVMVLTASAHRHAALEACAFIMDHLKTKATFWKKEQTPEGSRWVRSRESDTSALERWDTASEQTDHQDKASGTWPKI